MYIILVITFLISLIGTNFIRKFAVRKKVLDIPNERSSHRVPTPQGGGFAIAIAWFVGITWLLFQNKLDANLFYAFISGGILVIIGVFDDIFHLKPIIRFFFQLLTTALGLYFINGLQKIDLGIFVIENEYILTGLAFIGIVWFINLFNFMDGIDGYASMEAIYIGAVLFFLTTESFYLILIVSISGFLIWNWQPAKVFMGDTGSTLLGYNFGILAVYEQNTSFVSIIIFLIISSLFWFDATQTLIRRLMNKEKLSVAHKKHAYQRIVQAGFTHQKTVFFALLLNLLFVGLLYSCWFLNQYCIIFLILNICILYLFLRIVDRKKPF